MRTVDVIFYKTKDNNVWMKQGNIDFSELPSVGDIYQHPHSSIPFLVNKRVVNQKLVRIYIEDATELQKELMIDPFMEAELQVSNTTKL